MKDVRLASRLEVAEHLGVTVGTMAQWAHRRVGPRYISVGRHTRYRWSDVDAWLREHERGAKGAA